MKQRKRKISKDGRALDARAVYCDNDRMMVAEGLRVPKLFRERHLVIKTPKEKELLKELKKEDNAWRRENNRTKMTVYVPFTNVG